MITNTVASNNIGCQGGFISSEANELQIMNSTFSENKATIGGSVVSSLLQKDLLITNCEFYDNIGNNFGAIYLTNFNSILIQNSTFYNNSAIS